MQGRLRLIGKRHEHIAIDFAKKKNKYFAQDM